MKKLLIFLMVLIPLVVIFIVNVTVDIVGGVVSISVDKVVLDHDNYVANINEPFKLNAKVQPEGASDKTIIWSSSNEAIATVDGEGNVTFHAFGAVDIVATSGDGLKKANCRINITDTRAHDIEIFAEKTTLTIGETCFVWASVIPSSAENQNYVLRSSNENIISLNASGVATANGVGSAIITATSIDGNYEKSITIDVKIPVSSISIIPEEEEITIGSPSILLNYEIQPTNATYRQVSFSSSDPSTATVDANGRINFLKTGSVFIVATTHDGGFTDKIKVTYTGGYPTSLELDKKELNVDISDGVKATTINYTLTPSDTHIKNIYFISNNTNVAIVNQTGLVKIVGGGTATITVKIQTGEDEYIFDSVLINSKRDITNIEFAKANLITATNKVSLYPTIYPADATNFDNLVYEIIEGENATISANGEITFNEVETIKVKVYLKNNPSVFTTINVIYTNGYPYSVEKVEDEITINAGENGALNFILNPTGVTNKQYIFKIVSTSPVNAGDIVITLDETSGRFTAISGGTAIVRLYVKTGESSEITTDYVIHVNKSANDIDFDIDEDYFENSYVTGDNKVIFNAIALPLDATDNEITYSISDNTIAKIIGNKIHFNQAGKITLTATLKSNSKISKSVTIWYTGGYAISADISALPNTLIAGETTFDVSLSNIIPANASNKSFLIELSNQQSIHNNNILSISYNSTSTLATIKALNAGSFTFSVVLAGSTSPIYSKSIEVLRKVEKIEFITQSGETPNTQIDLLCNVLPIDASVKAVSFTLSESYSSIAYIANNKLIFKESDNDKETVIVTASLVDIDGVVKTADIKITTTFGKIVAPEGNEITLAPSNQVVYNYSSELIAGYELKYVIKTGENLIAASLNDAKLSIIANKVGYAQIEVQLINSTTKELFKIIANIKLTIAEKITNIEISSDDLNYFNNRYYTAKASLLLNILLTPAASDINSLTFRISDNNIASFDENTKMLTFLKAGIVELTISTKDNQLSKKFTIQYTKETSVSTNFNLNEDANNNLSLNAQKEIRLISYIPQNFDLTIVEIKEILQSGNNSLLEIQIKDGKYYLKALKSGRTNLQVKLSDGTIKNFAIIVTSSIEKIDFAQSEIITANKVYTLNPILTPTNPTNKNLIYKSSDDSIATVSNSGVVNFLKKGKVTIIVYSEANEAISASIVITSTFGEISDFTLNFTKLNLVVGEMRILSANSIFPSDAARPTFRYELIYSEVNNGHTGYNVITLNNGAITAEHGGIAVIKVYVELEDGSEISKTCEIEVERPLNTVDIELVDNLDIYQNYYVTSREEIEFSILTSPFDATITSRSITIDDNSIAEIVGNKIVFKNEGIVKITAVINGITKTLSIRHTKTAISFELDNITGTVSANVRTIELLADTSLTINPKNVLPSDLMEKDISLTLLLNTPNCVGDAVCEIIDNTIYARKGGKARFKISVAGKESIEILEIIVIKKATAIEVVDEIKTSKDRFALNASIFPADATSPVLKYTITKNTSIATINKLGIVAFTDEGDIEVEIKNEYSNLSKIIKITFSRGIKTIEFDNSPDYVFIGKTLQLAVIVSPENIANETVEWSIISGAEFAEISQTGLLTPKKLEGVVEVCAKIAKYDISVTKLISVYAIITDINMDDDASNDKLGIAEEHVYGTHFAIYTPDGPNKVESFTNTFQLGFSLMHNAQIMPQLEYRSSDETIATVSSTGMVTILKPGKVTISIYPKKQIGNDPSKYIYDSYTFNFISGLNVYDTQDFIPSLKKYDSDTATTDENTSFRKTVILQSDIDCGNFGRIKMDEGKTLYGNGFLINFKNGESKYSSYLGITSNTLIRNAHFRSYNFKPGESIMVLEGKGSQIEVDENSSNITIEYSLFESGHRNILVRNSQIDLKGCIFTNSYNAGVLLTSSSLKYNPNIANVDSCIFDNNMLGGISNATTNEEESKKPAYITFYRFVDFYTWQPLSLVNEIDISSMDSAGSTIVQEFISGKLTNVLNNYGYLFKTYNGEKYLHIGVMTLEGELTFEGKGFKLYNNLHVTFNTTNNPYALQVIREPILSGTMSAYNYCLSGSSNNSIQPGTSYKDNVKAAYEKIRRSLAS